LEYSDLYLQIAPKLYEAGLYQDALAFYLALSQHPSLVSPSLYIEMGKSYLEVGLNVKAEDSFQMAIRLDDDNVEARMELAKMYERVGEQEQAFIYVNEVMSIKRSQNTRLRPGPKPGRVRPNIDSPRQEPSVPEPDPSIMATRVPRTHKTHRLADPAEKQREENARTEQLQTQYYTMRMAHEKMLDGEPQATEDWMDAARDLTDDFRSFKAFYPWDKYVKFLGYTTGSRAQAETTLDSDITAMAERLSRSSSSYNHILKIIH
jgi:general transcription factor 3C polypeptide 3 (transcription factor C subunit 4)